MLHYLMLTQTLLRFGNFYHTNLIRRPVVTQCLTLGVLYTASDLFAQQIEKLMPGVGELHGNDQANLDSCTEPSKGTEIERTLHMGAFGGAIEGPVLHWWYKYLDKRIPARTAKAVTTKLIADQVICAPVLLCLFFPILGALKRQSWEQIQQKFTEDFVPLFVVDLALWIPANIINFRYIPPRYRVTYVGVVSFVWGVVLAVVGGHEV